MKQQTRDNAATRLLVGALLLVAATAWLWPTSEPAEQSPHEEVFTDSKTPESSSEPVAASTVLQGTPIKGLFKNDRFEPEPGVNLAPGAVAVERLTLGHGNGLEVAKGELLIRFGVNVTPEQMRAFHRDHGTHVVQRSKHHPVRRVRIAHEEPLVEVLARVMADSRVSQVTPNTIARGAKDKKKGKEVEAKAAPEVEAAPEVAAAPEAEPEQLPLLEDYQWQFVGTGEWSDAQKLASSASGVTVALLDSGVAYEDYEDWSGRYAQAPDLGCTEFVSPYDFINDDAHANDDHQHGTFLASLLVANPTCGALTHGYATGVSIMPVKVLDHALVGTEMALIEGLCHAIHEGADIINMSLSFSSGYTPSTLLLEVLGEAADNNIVVVAASGNDGSSQVLYPAAASHVIAVGATRLASKTFFGQTTLTNTAADYSNYGTELTVMAPGGLLSDDINDDGLPDGLLAQTFSPGAPEDFGYWLSAGTSQAVVSVTGLAALMMELGADSNEVRATMTHYADKPTFDGSGAFQYGSGTLKPEDTLEAVKDSKALRDPNYYVDVTTVLEQNSDGERVARAVMQIVDEAFEPAPRGTVVVGRWFGAVEANASCMVGSDAEGRCALQSPSFDPAKISNGVMVGFEVAQVQPVTQVWPGEWWEQLEGYGHHVVARSFFQLDHATADGIQEAVSGLEDDATAVLAFYVDPENAELQGALGSETLEPGYIIRDLTPLSGRKPRSIVLDEVALAVLAPEDGDDGTSGNGLGASSRLIFNLAPMMLQSARINTSLSEKQVYTSLMGGNGLGASSLITNDLTSVVINDRNLLVAMSPQPSYWFSWGNGLGASSKIVFDVELTFNVALVPIYRFKGLHCGDGSSVEGLDVGEFEPVEPYLP